jgi:hypothetical protein
MRRTLETPPSRVLRGIYGPESVGVGVARDVSHGAAGELVEHDDAERVQSAAPWGGVSSVLSTPTQFRA